VRSGRADVIAALAPLEHHATALCVAAERAVSRAMGGSCSMPLAAHAHFDGEYLQLAAAWGDPDRPAPLVQARSAEVVADAGTGRAVGAHVAAGCAPAAPTELAMRVIVTRPAQEAARWVARCARAATTPWPAAAGDHARPRPRPLRPRWQALPRYGAVMFVSANAVQGFLRRSAGAAWPPARAPGRRARHPRRLAGRGRAGRRIDAPADDAPQFDSESLWARCGPAAPGSRVLLVRGAGADGRGQGRDGCRSSWPRRRAVETWSPTRARCRRGRARSRRWPARPRRRSCWLFSSSEAARNLRSCCRPGLGRAPAPGHPSPHRANRARAWFWLRAGEPAGLATWWRR
jgi:uroporphyrinogen-III synthase